MVRKFLLLIMWLIPTLIALPNFAATKLLIFGDSLSAAYGIDPTESWVTLLEEEIKRKEGQKAVVVNASVSGETTIGGLYRLPEILSRVQPNIVLLELGGNDGLRGYSLEAIKKNLREMLSYIHQSGAHILLAGMRLPPNYGVYADDFYKIYQSLAKEFPMTFIPFFLEGVAGIPSLMQSDGIHPTEQAQRRIFEQVWKFLEPILTPE